MINLRKYITLAAVAAVLLASVSCSDDLSYSDRLNIERNSVNAYLANNRVRNEIPEDSIFITGSGAPFYRLDDEGNVYMQVVNAGDRVNDRAVTDETIYFRYTRYSLNSWYSYGYLIVDDTNEADMSVSATSFKYMNFTLSTSSQWGYGLQMPLTLLGVECEVHLIIKSQYGLTDEIANVTPYLYHVRYYHSQI